MPDRETLRRILLDLIEDELKTPCPPLQDATDLRLDLGMDSLEVFSVLSSAEQRLGVRLSQPEREVIVTAGDLINLLQARLVTIGSHAA